MTQIREIFIDLDDVLCTMAPHMLASVGCPVTSTDYSVWPRDLGFDIQFVANRLLKADYTWYTFWEAVPPEAWTTIPKTTYANWLLETCAKMVGQRNVYIATAPIDAPSCASGKMEWMQRNLPQWIHRQFLITPCKFVASHPGALLIDDFEGNIRFFQGRGGSTIIVPRPWNRLRGREPSGHIAMELFHTFGYRG